MAQIIVVDTYPVSIQATSEKRFTDRETGKTIQIDAQKAREAVCLIGKYEESVLPFILPEHFDAKQIKPGYVLNVTCPSLETFKMFPIKNVNRVLSNK